MKILVKVKNCKGTDNSKVWIDEWVNKMGRTPMQCSNVDCTCKENICGGHIVKVNGVPDAVYIVPICAKCNALSPDTTYGVYADDMILIEE